MTKPKPGAWTFSPQRGEPGHCLMAQVWGSDGMSLAQIDTTENPAEASAIARLFAASPELLQALKAIQFGNNRRCPACHGWNVGPNGETDMAHTKDCYVSLAIAKAEGRE